MGIMPYTDIERALECALSLDIPFWPQLPNISFYEDMYVQASQNFPGIVVDDENKKLQFDSALFKKELSDYAQNMADPKTFALTESYSAVYHRFQVLDLHPGLNPGAEDTDAINFGWDHIFCHNQTRHRRPDIGQITFIQQDARQGAVSLGKQQDEAVAGRKADFKIFIKPGGNLDGKVVILFNILVFNMDITRRFLEDHLTHRGHDDPALRIRDKAVFDIFGNV